MQLFLKNIPSILISLSLLETIERFGENEKAVSKVLFEPHECSYDF